MSEVISFRLNKNNPRETQALMILEAWCSKGYSVRYVITEALLKLNDPNKELIASDVLQGLNATLEHISNQLKQIGNGENLLKIGQADKAEPSGLTDKFLSSIKKAAKPGIRADQGDIRI